MFIYFFSQIFKNLIIDNFQFSTKTQNYQLETICYQNHTLI